jgi:hypothetical protein
MDGGSSKEVSVLYLKNGNLLRLGSQNYTRSKERCTDLRHWFTLTTHCDAAIKDLRDHSPFQNRLRFRMPWCAFVPWLILRIGIAVIFRAYPTACIRPILDRAYLLELCRLSKLYCESPWRTSHFCSGMRAGNRRTSSSNRPFLPVGGKAPNLPEVVTYDRKLQKYNRVRGPRPTYLSVSSEERTFRRMCWGAVCSNPCHISLWRRSGVQDSPEV